MTDAKKSKYPRGPPSWIDVALIQQALRNSGEANAEVAAISVGCATSKGDNYASIIYRVKATLTDGGERSLIVKGPEPWQTEESRSFVRETIMLTQVLPQLEAMLEEATPGWHPRLAPRCYHHGRSPVQFIVMEDLGPPGFRLGDRRRGLGLRHSLLALRGLARYHAATHALLRRRPEAARQLDNLWRSMAPAVTRFVHCGLQATADACRGWPGCEQLASRLEKFKDIAMETFTELNEPKPGAFNVLVHGDFWINNLMFRYEDGEVADFLPVDFQFPHEASPAIDLLYFLGAASAKTCMLTIRTCCSANTTSSCGGRYSCSAARRRRLRRCCRRWRRTGPSRCSWRRAGWPTCAPGAGPTSRPCTGASTRAWRRSS